ncbi:methyl-accepting chemotaxis protein [Megalodesulfovibrio paquesii]
MRLTLLQKLAGLVVVVVVVLALSIGIASIRIMTGQLEHDYATDVERKSKFGAFYLQSIQDKCVNIAVSLAADTQLIKAVQANDAAVTKTMVVRTMKAMDMHVLVVTDATGKVIARGHSDRSGDSIASQTIVSNALSGRTSSGFESGSASGYSMRAGAPILQDGKVIGVVTCGFEVAGNEKLVDNIKDLFLSEATVFAGDTRVTTTIIRDGKRAVGTRMDNPDVLKTVLERREPFKANNTILGQDYATVYLPLLDAGGKPSGMFFLGVPRKNIAAAQANLRNDLILVTALAGVVVLALGVYFAYTIRTPILKATRYAEAVAEGNLDLTLDVQSKDETGILANSLRTMVASLKERIQEANTMHAEAAKEAERARKAMQEADEANQRAALAAREGVLDAARRIEGVVRSVSAAADEMAAMVEQIARGTAVQKDRIQETATAMEEMNATVVEVARNASDSSRLAQQATDAAREGQNVVADSSKAILGVDEAAKGVGEQLASLGKLANGIGQIITVIQDIADQTNLLALNAAIEAARAGDAGRGFAVVADEVRKLAEKTMTATREVSGSITAIQEATRKALSAMDQASGRVQAAAGLASQSGEVLQQIVVQVTESSGQAQAIAAAAQQQGAASEEIRRAIEEVNEISDESAKAMDRAADSVRKLAAQARDLDTIVEGMKSA